MMLCNCYGVSEDEFKKFLTDRKSLSKETLEIIEDFVGTSCESCVDRIEEICKLELMKSLR